MDISSYVRKYGNLFIRSKFLVDGLYQGKHRSITPGYSVEFTEHRPYEIGDDLRFVDWKVYARTDRFMVKKFTDETEMDVYLFVDTSGSMGYEDKFYNAILIAGTFLYLFHHQKDRVSLFTTSGFFMPPTRRKNEVREMFRYLENVTPSGVFVPEHVFSDFSNRIKKRGFIILISDFLYDVEHLGQFVRFMREKHRMTVGFMVLSKKEMDFPFRGGALFKGLEEKDKLELNADIERKIYKKALEVHIEKLSDYFKSNGGNLIVLSQSDPVKGALREFLGGRK